MMWSMKKIFAFFFSVIVFEFASYSQQDPQYTNNMYYKLGVNPGYAGAENAMSGLFLNRYQWEGFKGAPKTLVFSMDAAVNMFGTTGGIGLNFIKDQLGFEENTIVNASYAYKTSLSFGDLGVGLSVGLYSKAFNAAEWESTDDIMGGSSGGEGDYLIPQGEASQMAFDAGLGLYLSSNHYYIGASVTHINQAAIKYADLASIYLARHYYLMGGYNIKLSDPLFELRPSFLFKSDLAVWQLDVNTNVVFDDKFWGGVSYRVNDAIALLVGLEMVNGLKVGYSFDLVTWAGSRYGFASHEIFVTYSVDLDKNRSQKYKSVRFL